MKKIIKEIESKGISALVGGIIGLIVFVFGDLTSEILSFLKTNLSSGKLLGVIGILIMTNVIFFYLLIKERKKSKLKYKFGVFWDGNKVPYCNACKKPLGQYTEWHLGGYGFKCVSCKQIISLRDAKGNMVTYEEALIRL